MSEYESNSEYTEPIRNEPQRPAPQPEHIPDFYRAVSPVPKKKHTAGKMVALALCCSLLGGALGAGGVLALQGWGKPTPENRSMMLEGMREKSTIDIVSMDTSRLLTPAQVYAANVHSTVGITTSVTTNYFGFPTTSAASGSGFIISDDGYVLTNYHVIENSNSITVSMYDGASYEAALIGYDESNDIAVLKIEAEGLTPVILGDSDALSVGDSVVAIGNPLGELTFSLTSGYVSAKDRQVTFSGNVTMNLIQTDAAINSGNSGGALFNMYGEVIGVTNAKYSSSSSSQASIDNIGFAIPINSIRSIVESIIEKGYISKPYMGVSVMDVGTEARMYGLPQGAAIGQIAEGGPAEKAGLQVGDIITKANDTEITSSNDLIQFVSTLTAGDVPAFTIYRQGQELTITVTIEEKVQEALPQAQPSQSSSQQVIPWFFGGRR